MPKLNAKNAKLLQELYSQGVNLLRAGQAEVAVFPFEAALEIAPRDFDVLHMLGIAYSTSGKHALAQSTLRRATEINPASASAHLNYGIALKNTGEFESALKHQNRAARLAPEDANVHYNFGNTLRDMGQIEAAIQAYQHAISLKPTHQEALNNLGTLLERNSEYGKAAECCAALIAAGSRLPNLHGRLFRLHMQTCNWSAYPESSASLLARMERGEPAATPFALITTPASPELLKQSAKAYATANFPSQSTPLWKGKHYAHPRIRIGYFSSDFFGHATAYLLAEVIEKHDRNQFEIYAFSFGFTRNDDLRKRLESGVEHFVDVSDKSDQEIAQLARQSEIDIAIDLKGYTESSRTGIFACRPAPIQINYLGFPGTMGADFIDYIIADHTLIPAELEAGFSEKILRLPDSYQPNDTHRADAIPSLTRQALGLPGKGFVFCSFNNNFKITPEIFDIWMRLLANVGGSVLWLFEDNAEAASNLRREATRRNISADRLVFAQRTDLAMHLARHQCADLFLDTFPCNAHTTASDALLTGLPVLTLAGSTFSSRVAASLLKAVNFEELITTSFAEYEALALALATAPERIESMRKRLREDRANHPLFNSARYIGNLEYLLRQAHERQSAGLAPENIAVPIDPQCIREVCRHD